jgi:protocatechuate 3,4-dioxygenase beta subunit
MSGYPAAVPARVVSLMTAVLGAVTAVRRKVALATLVAATLIATGAGLLAGRASAPAAGEPPQADAPKVAADARLAGPAAAGKNECTIAGRVIDADGKPVPGVEVAAVAPGRLGEQVLARGRAGADGRFRIGLAAARAKFQAVYVVAGKDGHGLAWEKIPAAAAASETVLRLPPEKVVRGRVLDLQGLPVAGAEVRAPSVPAWKDFAAWPKPAVAGKDGQFVLRGLSPDFDGYVRVEGADFAPQLVEIKPGAANSVQEMNLTLLPAHILEGTVTGEDTGKPVPGALVKLRPGGWGQSDERGHYRIKLLLPDNSYKLPPGGSHRVWVTAPDDQPYLPLEAGIAWPKGTVRYETKFALKRGVLVRGKVTDASSGQPVEGAVIHDAAGLWTRCVLSEEDGTFQIAVAPGRGHLLVKGPNNDYVALQITSDELSGGKPSGYRLYPDAVIPLDLKKDARESDVAVKLRRGVTVRGRLLGPDGQPAAEAVLLCWNQLRPDVAAWFGAAVAVRDGAFALRGCDPDETYPVHFLDAKNRRGATVQVTPKEAGDRLLTVRLQPCGQAVVRFVDRGGKPVPDFSPEVRVVARPGGKGVDADSDSVANVDPLNYGGGGPVADAAGRCTLPALIPGVTYRLNGPGLKAAKEVVVKPGETLDVGNVVVDR